jgi:hypothetical protein
VSLGEELEQAARAASHFGVVRAVLAAEPTPGARAYLVTLGGEEARTWLLLDDLLEPVAERERVREAASIVVLCELAAELAAGGRLEELQARLDELGDAAPGGRDEAVSGALADLVEVIAAMPRISSPILLDRIGEATRRLERELGDHRSPLAGALAAHMGTVEAFIAEVDARYLLPLR